MTRLLYGLVGLMSCAAVLRRPSLISLAISRAKKTSIGVSYHHISLMFHTAALIYTWEKYSFNLRGSACQSIALRI